MGDAVGLSNRWARSWPNVPPDAFDLRLHLPDRWVRFHTLPGSKRYPETDEERAGVLARHNALLSELVALTGDPDLLVITSAWGDRSERTRRPDLIAVDPDATWWRSDLMDDTERDSSWTHLWVSRRTWATSCLDPLLALVADDATAGVIIAPASLAWLYSPYDGGADVIAPDTAARHNIAAAYAGWRSTNPEGL